MAFVRETGALLLSKHPNVVGIYNIIINICKSRFVVIWSSIVLPCVLRPITLLELLGTSEKNVAVWLLLACCTS